MEKREKEDKFKLHGWVVQMLHEQAKAKTRTRNSETTRMWLIELPLTSGEVYAFYVKAKTKQDALRIAEGYEYLAHHPELRKQGFTYRPST